MSTLGLYVHCGSPGCACFGELEPYDLGDPYVQVDRGERPSVVLDGQWRVPEGWVEKDGVLRCAVHARGGPVSA